MLQSVVDLHVMDLSSLDPVICYHIQYICYVF